MKIFRNAKILIVFLSLFIFGCSKNAEVVKRPQGATIKNYSTSLGDIFVLGWTFGIGLKKVTLSKGFRAKVELPRLSEEDILFLYNKLGVNAWVARVRQVTQSGNTKSTKGFMYAPLVRRAVRNVRRSLTKKSKVRAGSLRSIYFQIVYPDVGPSKRFEQMRCPAFGHNLSIEDTDIISLGSSRDVLIYSAGRTLSAKPKKVELAPVQFTGGKSIIGNYVVDIALYDSNERKLLSNWITINQMVSIQSEKEHYLKGCDNFRIPKKPKDVDGNRQFRLGR